ncbi:unnamed protein product [Acidocella sp. C78]|nr:unnamed protein product [Acidocella sp. C78]
MPERLTSLRNPRWEAEARALLREPRHRAIAVRLQVKFRPGRGCGFA